jgi:hypothetical protein
MIDGELPSDHRSLRSGSKEHAAVIAAFFDRIPREDLISPIAIIIASIFTFELLQNAEDALARRSAWQGSLSVQFDPHQTGPPRRSL